MLGDFIKNPIERPTKPRMPKDFNDCLLPLRLDNCVMCSYKPQRGVNWKTCMLRVRMFRAEGGAYPGV